MYDHPGISLSLVFFCYFRMLVLTLFVFADLKQRTTGMRYQMEALVYVTDTNTSRQGLKLWPESPALVFSCSAKGWKR